MNGGVDDDLLGGLVAANGAKDAEWIAAAGGTIPEDSAAVMPAAPAAVQVAGAN